MSALASLSIELVYTDETVGPWTLGALSRNEGVIHPDHLEGDAFYDVLGGLQISTNRIFRFLDVQSATDLVSYVRFLIGSVVELRGQPMPERFEGFRSDSAYEPVIATAFQDDASRVQLRVTPDGLAIDYLNNQGDAPEGRGSLYFDGLLVDSEAWKDAALEALAEYRAVLTNLLSDGGAPGKPVQELMDALDHFSKPHS